MDFNWTSKQTFQIYSNAHATYLDSYNWMTFDISKLTIYLTVVYIGNFLG